MTYPFKAEIWVETMGINDGGKHIQPWGFDLGAQFSLDRESEKEIWLHRSV
jgi:hypothetical protein